MAEQDSLITTSFYNAVDNFSKFYSSAESELEKIGVVKIFEMTYEVVWKTLKRILD